jgi:transposase
MTPGLEPINNLAERAIRFVVIDRLIPPGTRIEAGNRWRERIWSVIATCLQHGRSVFSYLEAAVGAWLIRRARDSQVGRDSGKS